MTKKYIYLLFFVVSGFRITAQSCITLRYFGLTVHPFGDNQAYLEPNKIDKHAFTVLNYGGFVGYEKFVWEDFLSVKIMQGVFSDCSAGAAGFSHLGIRALLLEKKKHRLLFGIGPTLYYRQDWNRFDSYEDTHVFKHRHIKYFGDIQYKMFWYGLEFEYDYKLNNRTEFNFGFTPGLPMALTFSFGIKYWVSKNFKRKEKFVVPK